MACSKIDIAFGIWAEKRKHFGRFVVYGDVVVGVGYVVFGDEFLSGEVGEDLVEVAKG